MGANQQHLRGVTLMKHQTPLDKHLDHALKRLSVLKSVKKNQSLMREHGRPCIPMDVCVVSALESHSSFLPDEGLQDDG
jgi:hypothetical protein